DDDDDDEEEEIPQDPCEGVVCDNCCSCRSDLATGTRICDKDCTTTVEKPECCNNKAYAKCPDGQTRNTETCACECPKDKPTLCGEDCCEYGCTNRTDISGCCENVCEIGGGTITWCCDNKVCTSVYGKCCELGEEYIPYGIDGAEGKCCKEGEGLVNGEECCPTDRICGKGENETCCPDGFACKDEDKGICCEPNDILCGETCCEEEVCSNEDGNKCCENVCSGEAGSWCCDGKVCTSEYGKCCEEGEEYIGEECCPTDRICGKGESETCCPDGFACKDEDKGICCEPNDILCGETCCEEEVCSNEDGNKCCENVCSIGDESWCCDGQGCGTEVGKCCALPLKTEADCPLGLTTYNGCPVCVLSCTNDDNCRFGEKCCGDKCIPEDWDCCLEEKVYSHATGIIDKVYTACDGVCYLASNTPPSGSTFYSKYECCPRGRNVCDTTTFGIQQCCETGAGCDDEVKQCCEADENGIYPPVLTEEDIMNCMEIKKEDGVCQYKGYKCSDDQICDGGECTCKDDMTDCGGKCCDACNETGDGCCEKKVCGESCCEVCNEDNTGCCEKTVCGDKCCDICNAEGTDCCTEVCGEACCPAGEVCMTGTDYCCPVKRACESECCPEDQVCGENGCECDPALEACTGGQVRDETTCECKCPDGQELCGVDCYDVCVGGQIMNPICECECPEDKPDLCKNECHEACPDGLTRDETTCECKCPDGQELCGDDCYDVCDGGQVRNASCECECPAEMPNKCGNVCCVGDCNAAGDGCGCPDEQVLCGGDCCLVCNNSKTGCCDRVVEERFIDYYYFPQFWLDLTTEDFEAEVKDWTGRDDVSDCRPAVFPHWVTCADSEGYEMWNDSSQTPYYCKTDDDCPDRATCKTWTWATGAYCCDS
ncbi:MAG: hypothetical protein J6U64_00720, partial [Alphaproteobacteria bacterium]|nr:hypothetical protein [Alphaproteobacteria bacterium]